MEEVSLEIREVVGLSIYIPPVEVLTKEVMGLVALWVGVCFIVVIAPTYLVMDRKSISLRKLWGW